MLARVQAALVIIVSLPFPAANGPPLPTDRLELEVWLHVLQACVPVGSKHTSITAVTRLLCLPVSLEHRLLKGRDTMTLVSCPENRPSGLE